MTAQQLRTNKEKKLFLFASVVSALAWITLIVTVVGLAYGIFFGFFFFATHSLMIAYIKGHGVRLSPQQFPEIYGRVAAAAEKLGLAKTPEVYILQASGALNAFATKWTGRNFVVVYSDLLEACGEDGKEIDMIIGHEIGHLALGHLKWLWFLLPAKLVPLLGSAYSRACEYSCDQCGLEVTGDLDAAARGLAVLSAGGKYGKQIDLSSFVDQTWDTGGFWASVYELNASHPYLPKRVAALINKERPGYVKTVHRSILAYPFAPILGLASPGGSAPLAMIAVMGILAAIAIPQFEAYKDKADKLVMEKTLAEAKAMAQIYYQNTGHWPCNESVVTNSTMSALLKQKQWQFNNNCEDKIAMIIYKSHGKECYRSISYNSGEMREGTLSDNTNK